MSANGTLTTLVSFDLSNRGPVLGALVEGSDGNFYGMTRGVLAPNTYGTIFRLSADGTLTTLVSFNRTNGANPYSALVQGSDGSLYGTTLSGGANNIGTVFRVSTNGTLTTLVSFNYGVEGAYPSSIVEGSDGNFYGTAPNGLYGAGTVFKLGTNGTMTTLVSFNGTNGSSPSALVQGTDGNFYGTTEYGGANNEGTVFRMSSDGTLSTLVSFNGGNGQSPAASLVQGGDGNFYGTTESGGTNGFGSVFKITRDGTLTTLASFDNWTDGSRPSSALVQGSDGNFYGTTSAGGAGNIYGAVFKVSADGTLTGLVSFNGTNGSEFPTATALVQGSDGNFYGTTPEGGNPSPAGVGDGTIFKMSPLGVLTTLVSFNVTNGGFPTCALVRSNGDFYGATSAFSVGYSPQPILGTIFKASADGNLTTLVTFNGANGYAASSLIRGSDGNFYGTAGGGGPLGGGLVFKFGEFHCPAISIGPTTLPSGSLASYNETISASGGVAPYNYAITSGSLPPGLAITSDGVLSGVPTSLGEFSFTVTAMDANGCDGSSNYTMNVTCPTITVGSATLTNGILGSAYSEWMTATSMNTARGYHTATLLADGRMLVAGGSASDKSSLASAELYNPATADWTSTGSMITPRYSHAAVLLPNRKVLVWGGTEAWFSNGQESFLGLDSAEIYDPSTGNWTDAGSTSDGGPNCTLTLLPNGKVLGVSGNTAALYDSTAGTWQPTQSPAIARYYATPTLLPNGKVLLAGGQQPGGGQTSTAELYDTVTGTWTITGSMNHQRSAHTATLLLDGNVLIVGGGGTLSTELYNPTTGTWTITGSMNHYRNAPTATLLSTGEVLVAGGAYAEGSAEVYNPAKGTWGDTAEPLNTARIGHTATLLASGRVLIAGSSVNAGANETAATEFFVQNVQASNGLPPYTYQVSSGTVPIGMALTTDGFLSGTAFALGTNVFTITATDANGCTGSGTYTLVVQPSGSALDTNPPAVTIALPKNKAITNTDAITVVGTAKDSSGKVKTGVAEVLYSLNGGSQQLAGTTNNFTNWSASVTLQPGWNSFIAQAFDFRGNASTPVSRTLLFGASSNAAGTYNGLFFETNGVGAPAIAEQSAGAVLNVVVQFSGAYSGRIHINGGNYPLKGTFDLSGNTTTTVSRGTSSPLHVNLHLDWSGATKQMTGTVSCAAEGWSAPLLADLAVYGLKNPYPVSRYTMAISPASDAPTSSPGGYGYGLISIGATGHVGLAGALADSTPISESVSISKDGHWPLYVDLYKHQGLLEGWIDFSSGAPAGDVTWIKPSTPPATNITLTTYLSGFTNEVNVFGSVYTSAVPAITLADYELDITDGSGLNLPLTLGATVSATDAIVKLPSTSNTLSGLITKTTGLLKVHFRPSGAGSITKTATGVVLQSSNAAYGAFIGNNDGTNKTNTGAIYLH